MRAKDAVQLGEGFPSMCKALGSISSTSKKTKTGGRELLEKASQPRSLGEVGIRVIGLSSLCASSAIGVGGLLKEVLPWPPLPHVYLNRTAGLLALLPHLWPW